jgi:hypothetical protein
MPLPLLEWIKAALGGIELEELRSMDGGVVCGSG